MISSPSEVDCYEAFGGNRRKVAEAGSPNKERYCVENRPSSQKPWSIAVGDGRGFRCGQQQGAPQPEKRNHALDGTSRVRQLTVTQDIERDTSVYCARGAPTGHALSRRFKVRKHNRSGI
jgi:hypothetical protein